MRLDKETIARHNAEAEATMAAFRAGKPTRVPAIGGASIRYYLTANRLDFRRYFTDPEFMAKCQLETQKLNRSHITGDHPIGPPEKWDGVVVDFQNQYEAGWLGCEIVYPEEDVLWTKPMLAENKEAFKGMKIPDPLADNLMGTMARYYAFFRDWSAAAEFEGRPIAPPVVPCGTDGPFTLAVSLRGADNLCLDIYEDPVFVRDLLAFVTDAIIARIKASIGLMGLPYPPEGYWFADDAIVLLSPETYEEFVLPSHRKILSAFARPGAVNAIHLCGPIERHARLLYDKLAIRDIETGFPTDFDKLRAELKDSVSYRRTTHPRALWDQTPEEIDRYVEGLIGPSVAEGLRIAVRTRNAIAPGTPMKNLELFYRSVKKYGVRR